MIDRERIEELFARSRQLLQEGRATWNIDDVCRWSFFFVDADRERLVSAGKVLERAGYEFVGLLEPDEDGDDPETIYLRVDRVERHTVDSLVARNAELDSFAASHGLANYDGMDVGAIEGP